MDNLEAVIKGIEELVEDVVMTENEGCRRCLNPDDLNVFEEWIKLLNQANETKTSTERERLIHFLTESMKDKDSITIEQQVDTYLMNN